MGKLWLTLCLFASPVMAMENNPAWWEIADSPLLSNARGLQKEAKNYLNATENLLNISSIGEQLVISAEITDIALSSVNRIGGIVLTLKKLAVKANSDTIDSIDRSILDTTYKSSWEDIQRILCQTSYENHQIYSLAMADFHFHIMDTLKAVPLYTLQISALYPKLIPLQGHDVNTTLSAANMGLVVDQVIVNIALEKQKLSNSKMTILELLKENSEKHEKAEAKLNLQLDLIQDYLKTGKKLTPTQDK